MSSEEQTPLPVIIAGAGPCGLVAALTCQQAGVPFVIYERAGAKKLCSNAGSGIDMAPTAINILEQELKLPKASLDVSIRPYGYMWNADMLGNHLSTYRLKELDSKILDTRKFGFSGRALLQNVLLDALGLKDEKGNIKDDPNGVLRCGMSVTGYQNQKGDGKTGGFVEVKLSDDTTVNGVVLLACDGIHSAVRRHMHQDKKDPLNYCGQICWWGKCTVEPESKLDQRLKQIAQENKLLDGNVAIALVGTSKKPGCFFSSEVSKGVHAWAYVLNQKEAPAAKATDDLTRRGGAVLAEEEKKAEIDKLVADRAPVLRMMLESTPANGITRAGFFDRKNLDLPYTDGRVALLGDAAHPQSPLLGQGANMAIVDGYVAATRLAAALKTKDPAVAEQALAAFDTKKRRKANNAVIKKARTYGVYFVSDSWLATWATSKLMKWASASMVISDMISGDKSNAEFVAAMKKDLNMQ